MGRNCPGDVGRLPLKARKTRILTGKGYPGRRALPGKTLQTGEKRKGLMPTVSMIPLASGGESESGATPCPDGTTREVPWPFLVPSGSLDRQKEPEGAESSAKLPDGISCDTGFPVLRKQPSGNRPAKGFFPNSYNASGSAGSGPRYRDS